MKEKGEKGKTIQELAEERNDEEILAALKGLDIKYSDGEFSQFEIIVTSIYTKICFKQVLTQKDRNSLLEVLGLDTSQPYSMSSDLSKSFLEYENLPIDDGFMKLVVEMGTKWSKKTLNRKDADLIKYFFEIFGEKSDHLPEQEEVGSKEEV